MKNDQLNELLDRYLAGKCSPEEVLLIESWYEDLSEDKQPIYGGDEELLRLSQEQSINSLRSKLGLQHVETAKSGNDKNTWLKWLAAACVILGTTTAAWFYHSSGLKPIYITVASNIGQMEVLQLPDSSTIWLNAGSSLRYASNYGEISRDVYLEGEGYFDVKHNAKVPFNVYCGKLKTHVLGTAFSISSYSNASTATITVMRGKVQVGESSKLLGYLVPNQQLELERSTDKSRIIQVDANSVADWREGKLAFVNMPMQDIVAHLEKWYGVNFEFKDKSVEKRRFTASFSNHVSLKNLLEVIKSMSQVDYKFDEKSKTVIYY